MMRCLNLWLTLLQAKHERHQVVVAEELKWRYDKRIIVKGEVVEGDCTRVTLMGLGESRGEAPVSFALSLT